MLRDDDNIVSDDLNVGYEAAASPSHSTSSFKIAVAEFVIRTLEERKITQTAMNGIIKDLEEIWQMALEEIERCSIACCESAVANSRSPDSRRDDLRHFLSMDIVQPFKGLHTEYQRHKFFKDHFDFMVRQIVHSCIT